jgi:hypothetical protein
MRQEKKRGALARASTVQLLRTYSRSKAAPASRDGSAEQDHSRKLGVLRREVEHLLRELERQRSQVREIKTSKKYNKFVEVLFSLPSCRPPARSTRKSCASCSSK